MDGERLATPPSEMEMEMLQRLTPQQLTVQLLSGLRRETPIVRVLTVGLPEQTSRYPLQFSVSWMKQTLRQMTACKDKERYTTGFE